MVSENIHPALKGSLSPSVPFDEVINFSPGPTSLPRSVESKIAENFNKPKFTTLATSHRSPEFIKILKNTISRIKKVMEIPDNYEVLFTHGGGHGQFAAIPLNLCQNITDKATYVVNGTWSARARDEAKRYCDVQTIDCMEGATYFPELNENIIDPQSKFLYVCSNETVNGIELFRLPKLPESRKHIPLVVDASSDFSTKPIDWIDAGVGVLFACASKNIGHPGVTVTIVRKDLLGKTSPLCPGVFNYTTNSDAGNLWNTPATFNIEVVGMTMQWLEEEGGIHECEHRSIAKAKLIYDVIDNSKGFYNTPISDQVIRSRMNVPFDVNGGDQKLTEKFLIESWEQGIVGLQTLTPFGVGDYLRASLYNGITEENTAKLANFMTKFASQYSA